jgi:2-methylcitrate dehydratase PrpD
MSLAAKEYTSELVGFLHNLKPADLPREVLDRARYFLLDYLSVAIRGSLEPSAQAVYRMIDRVGANGNATIIGTGARTTAGLAAMANGTAAHGLEHDDTHSGGSIHLGAVMYSAALALAETLPDIAAEQFLTAVVAGYETAARIAMAVQPKEHYALGFHPTQTCGVFGAAVTASKLLHLSASGMRNAMGIAGSMAAGSMEFLADGSWIKRLHPGLAAHNGIHAAMIAAEGFTGPLRILEGRDGFLHGYSRKPIPELLTADLGKTFEILHTAVKPHACCRYMQGPIDAVLALVQQHDIAPGRIRNIEIGVLEAGWNIVVEPRAQKYNPESVVDAQFSMPFGAAVAVLYRAAGLNQFTLENVRNAAIREMMGKVTMVKDRRLEEAFPQEWPAQARIELTGGERYEKFVKYPKGDPQNPLTWEEMAAKFRSLAGAVLSPDRCGEIIRQVSADQPALLPALCAQATTAGSLAGVSV